MKVTIRIVTIADYNAIFELWNSTEQSRRALNPVDDSRDGIDRYLKRNPTTCFAAVMDGNDYRRMGIASRLVAMAEEALQKEGIQKVFGLVFKDNDVANMFWETQGYTARTNLNYRNKSMNRLIPIGK